MKSHSEKTNEIRLSTTNAVLKTGTSCAGMAWREGVSEDQKLKNKMSYMKQNQSSLSPPFAWYTMIRNGGTPCDRNSGTLCSVTGGTLLSEICITNTIKSS